MDMMRVVAYTRVSTDGQAGEDKYGLEVQKKQIQDYCDKNDMEIIKWYSDEGESGAKLRPGFDEIIYGDVFNPPVEAVVVAKSDRVARDINIYYYYKMSLMRKDIKLISISEDFGQLGVFSSMLEAFTMCVAEMERENIMKRTYGGRKAKAATGGYSGGRLPLGYKSENGRYVIHEEEAALVRLVYEMRDSGNTLKQIADHLNNNGYYTRKGGKFATSSIQSILDNERTYRGEYKYGDGDWVQGQHDPILK
jgi:site-specific DNA recombinase